MKVKLFDYNTKDTTEMESKINKFIKNKKVIDIRASTGGENCCFWHFIVVMYEEKNR